MADMFRPRVIFGQIAFVGASATIAFFHLLPVGGAPANLPGPDLIVLVVFAWAFRRPAYVPPLLVATVALVADFLFMRPPGLWAAATVLGLEMLRGRAFASRDLPFLVEWAMVAAVLAMMTFGQAAILLVFVVEQPPLGLTLVQLILTILVYPLVVLVTAFGLNIRRAAPGEVDELGRRL